MTKKRFFASVLALFLLLSCVALPTPAYAEGEEAPSNGLELSKTVKANGDGTYTITMESYTTGTVISSTKTVPVDIVLVLDQSGSMAYDFNGNSTSNNTARRQYAMKQAVNNFIDSVNGKYSEESDHRMAIVTFGSNAGILQGWTFVDAKGKTTLQGKISGLDDEPSGATNVAAGMGQAETLMGRGYSYTGTNTQRQKVVIVFTDGVPTTSTDFNTAVATNAIASAKNLKNSGATVYSVGIFNGADPNQLHGEKWDYTLLHKDIPCSGEVGSYWGGSWFSDIIGSNDFDGIDIAAGNRFLNYLSSNVPGASSIGLERGQFDPGKTYVGVGTGYKITANFAKSASNYYLTANDSVSLNGIFKTISENIQNANINLGSQTVVKDTVTKYFDLPENTNEIKVYTAAAKADGSFESPVASGLTPTVSGQAVSVTGFDFNANFVSDKVKEDGTYGKKLIVEFNVTPKDEFIGGNDVPTNEWENTGVYDKDGALVENFNDENTTPKVNVPVKDPAFTTADKTIYLGNSTEVSGLYTLGETTGWQYDYVKVKVDGVSGTIVSPENCKEYEITVTFKPKTEGTEAEGNPNSMDGVSKKDKATVHVLKPNAAVTLNDVERFYGETYTLGEDNKAAVTLEWKDMTADHTTIPAAEGTAPYTEDDLKLAYKAQGITVTDNQFTVPKDDVTITVKLMNGEEEITDAVITTTCNLGCDESRTDGTYIVHVKTATLIIQKSGASGTNEGFIFNVEGPENFRVSVKDNGTVKITGLPLGTYTVTEDTGWSWRYKDGVTISDDGSVTLTEENNTAEVTVTNTKTNKYLLDGNAYAQNNSALLSAGN